MPGLGVLLGILGGAVSFFGGFYLVDLKSPQEHNMLEAIAHGVGIYCMGKGIAIWGATALSGTIAERLRLRNKTP